MIYGNFKTQPGFTQPETLDGVKFAPTIWKSGYIEGRGRYLDPNTGKFIYSDCGVTHISAVKSISLNTRDDAVTAVLWNLGTIKRFLGDEVRKHLYIK